MQKVLVGSVNTRYIQTNLAIRYLKKYLEKYSKDVQVVLKEWDQKRNIFDMLNDIVAAKPDIVFLSVYIWNRDITLKLLRELKKIIPATKIILGGPEVSYDAESIQRDYPEVDIIIKGEGEVAALQIIQGKYTGDCSLITNLDEIPFPYDAKDVQDSKNKILYYESSMGCPFSCAYCLSSLDNKVRYFSLERVKQDLMFFMEHKVKLVKFVDRTFNLDPQRYLAIWEYILANSTGATKFHFEIAADLLTSEALELLNKVPKDLFQFEIGVQSAHIETLKKINRLSDLDKLKQNVLKINKNIHVHLDLVVGLPEEDLLKFEQSFNYVIALQPDMLQIGFLKVLKGTQMESLAQQDEYLYMDAPPYEILSNTWLNFSEIIFIKKIEQLVDTFYNSGHFNEIIKPICAKGNPFIFFKGFVAFLIARNYFEASYNVQDNLKYLNQYLNYIKSQ